MSATLFSDERSMLIEKVRKSGIVAFDEVSEIIRWIFARPIQGIGSSAKREKVRPRCYC